jgi:hypothetical protein
MIESKKVESSGLVPSERWAKVVGILLLLW